jgi:hypothetical protein
MIWVDSSCWGAMITDYNPLYVGDFETLLDFFVFLDFYYFGASFSKF